MNRGVGVRVTGPERLWSEEMSVEEKRKKRILAAFAAFLVFMWLCTVISKSVYGSQLPIVSTVSAEQKYIEHIVEADGIVEAGDKIPVTAMNGLRVDRLAVQSGDRLEEGDVILTVDTGDLQEMIADRQTEIAKLQTQIDAIVQNQELDRQKKELEEQRAREDYEEIARHEDDLVGRAAEAYSQVEYEIDKQRNAERERRRKEEEERKAAQRENDPEGAGEYEEEPQEDYAEEIPDSPVDEALYEELQQAAYAEADARWQRDNAVKDAEREVEDAAAPDSADASLEVNRLELASLQEEIARFQEILDAEGQIRTPRGGLVTDVYVDVGGRTSDAAVLLLADEAVPCRFKTVISQEQKKYVSLGDAVQLKLDGSREKDAAVDYLAESDTAPGSYDVYIDLPEGVGAPGLSGTMRLSESGEKQSCCVPAEAVHIVNARSYVYVAREREGILGKEYYASELNVKILDQNDSWVAVEGALDGDSRVIVSSTKELENGAAVRLEEE